MQLENAELDEKSRRFHAFEWLRKQALDGNVHAQVLIRDMVALHERIQDRKNDTG